MELQPLVGTACAHCKTKILVDVDGKNCSRCGLAIHRRCAREHKTECAGRPMVTASAHDYDEQPPLVWKPSLIAMVAAGVFALMLGLGMLVSSPPEPRPGEQPYATSKTKVALAWTAVVGGVALAAGGYLYERSRQSAAARR